MKKNERLFWIGAVVALILVLLYLQTCGKKVCPEIITSITQTKDTGRGKSDRDYVPRVQKEYNAYVPFWYDVSGTKSNNGNNNGNGNGNADDFIPPGKECPPPSIKVYVDTLHFDSLGISVVTDSVEGRILSRKYFYEWYNTTTTIERVIDITPKKKNKVYLGLEAFGNKQHPIDYFGGTVSFQFKSGQIIQTGYGYWGNKGYYKAAVMAPLSFHK